jgi:hypothetical protein
MVARRRLSAAEARIQCAIGRCEERVRALSAERNGDGVDAVLEVLAELTRKATP